MNKLLKYGVKKNDQNIILPNPENASNKDIEFDKIKTTNVNILLNRVRLDQKRALKKRIVFSIILAGLVSSLAIYFII
jgi:hypothetical protein